jgi:hypothetical protein
MHFLKCRVQSQVISEGHQKLCSCVRVLCARCAGCVSVARAHLQKLWWQGSSRGSLTRPRQMAQVKLSRSFACIPQETNRGKVSGRESRTKKLQLTLVFKSCLCSPLQLHTYTPPPPDPCHYTGTEYRFRNVNFLIPPNRGKAEPQKRLHASPRSCNLSPRAPPTSRRTPPPCISQF